MRALVYLTFPIKRGCILKKVILGVIVADAVDGHWAREERVKHRVVHFLNLKPFLLHAPCSLVSITIGLRLFNGGLYLVS